MAYSSLRKNTELTETDLRNIAPSIFADHKHGSRSDRFVHENTADVLEVLRKAGYAPVAASQATVRPTSKHPDRDGYQRHMIHLRDRSLVGLDTADRKVGDIVPEIILTNAADGTSAFRIDAGLFRLVCTNGLIVKSDDVGSIKISHSMRDLSNAVREAADYVAAKLPEIARATAEWDKIVLSPRQRTAMAIKALALRYGVKAAPITPALALEARRVEDEAPTLWRTYNVLEENLAKGGIEGRNADGRKHTTRSIKGVTATMQLEKALWELAETTASRH